MNIKSSDKKGINQLVLRITAWVLMIMSTATRTGLIFTGHKWVQYVGWTAFTIFAYMLAEGVKHSSDRYLYGKRLLLFAAVSEVFFNLLYGRSVFYPNGQNVMFTLLIGYLAMVIVESVNEKYDNLVFTILAFVLATLGANHVASALSFEYSSYGVYIMMAMYAASKTVYTKAVQFITLVYLTQYVRAASYTFITLGKFQLYVALHTLSILALIPIWLCSGRRGPNSLPLKIAFYVVYPLHLAIIYLIMTRSAG